MCCSAQGYVSRRYVPGDHATIAGVLLAMIALARTLMDEQESTADGREL